MSGPAPTPSGVPNIGIGAGLNVQGMLAPTNPFVDPDGMLNPTSFRFLFNLLKQIQSLQSQVNAINTRLHNAGIP